MRAKLVGLFVVIAWLAWARVARAQLAPQQDPWNFGSIAVGTPSTQLVTFIEQGPLDISPTVNLQGCSADWQMGPENPSAGQPLNAGQMLTVQVTLTPSARGTESCTLLLQGGLFPTLNEPMVGTAVAPVASVMVPNGPPVNFGSVVLGQGAPLTFTITNTTTDAGQNLHFGGPLTFTGSNAGDFTITSVNPPADLGPGMSTPVMVSFHPASAGARNATLTVTTNDPVDPVQQIAVTGTGTNPTISVSPSTFTYPQVVAGTTSDKAFAVNNIGVAGTLHVTSTTIAGSSWFVFTNSPAGSPNCLGAASCTFSPALAVAPGAATNLTVRCAPPTDTTGTQTATLVLISDSTTPGNNTAMLTCTAVKPDIAITPASLSHDFGNVHVGNSAPFSPLTIQNTGGAPLTFTIARSSTGSSGDFTLAGPGCSGGKTCSNTIAATSSASYTVTFAPTAPGSRSATLAITSNDQDPGDSPQAFALTGTGTQAVLSATLPSGGTMAFGSQAVGAESATQQTTLTDIGNEDLTITSAVLGGANPGDFLIKSGATGMQTLTNGGGSATWTIDCKPTVRGARTATFTVSNSSTNTPSYVVNLTCSGTGPNLVASMNPIAFGNVREGNTSQIMFDLTNNGETAATVSAFTLVPGNVGYNTSGVAAGDMIAAGTSKQVTVTFAPVAGMDGGNATLAFASNAVDSPTVVSISGVGQPFGVSITCPDCGGSPPAMDYGDVRWDQTKSEVFTIANTSTSDVTIEGLALTEVADFKLVTPPATPFVLHAGGMQTVTVQASPNDTMLGPFSGQLQVMTDLPSPMMVKTVALAVTSVSPALTVQPSMTPDFGGVDLANGTAATMTITVQNTGDGPMDINAWPALTGGPFTSPAGTTGSVAAGGMQMVTVSYLPATEKTAASPDSVDLVLTINGLFSAGVSQPSQQKITITGHGTTRHMQVSGTSIAFGDTYRNPSTADAPVQAVTVTNTGEAPLSIDAELDATSDPVFTLLDGGPITVPGNGSMDLHVRFVPTTDTGAFHGSITITGDDSAMPTASVSITGSAAARMITAAPTALDFGQTYEQVAVKLSDTGGALVITNNATDHSVTVRELDVTDDADGVFSVVTPGGVKLDPGQSASFDLAFTPDAVGDFTGHVKVYFDDDTIPDATVDLTGTGIEGRGSYYACGAGRGDAAAPVALALFVVISRRRAGSRRRGARPLRAAG